MGDAGAADVKEVFDDGAPFGFRIEEFRLKIFGLRLGSVGRGGGALLGEMGIVGRTDGWAWFGGKWRENDAFWQEMRGGEGLGRKEA